MHTASFWNIIIQWTSHDDLTEKSAETFFSFYSMVIEKKKLVKWQKFKTALCNLTKNGFRWISSACSSELRCCTNLQIHLDAKSMDRSSWKKCILTKFTIFFARQDFFTMNGHNWSQSWDVLIHLLGKKFKSLR